MSTDDWDIPTTKAADPDADYNAAPGLRWSRLSKILTSPLHFLEQDASADSPALFFGRMFHSLVLSPAEFAGQYVLQPNFGDCRNKANKQARDDWIASHSGITSVSREDWERCHRMRDAVHRNPAARGLMDSLRFAERSFSWATEDGIACKVKPDGFTKGGTLFDLKSTRFTGPHAFAGEVVRRHYHGQLAFYARGLASNGITVERQELIAVESQAPYDCAVYTLDEAAETAGSSLQAQALDTYRQLLATDHAPYGCAGPTGRMDLLLPKYALPKDEAEGGYDLTVETES